MKKIIAITCHQLTNPLIHTVTYMSTFDDNIILLHIDAKVDLDKFIFLESKNIFIIPERVDVIWGHFSQIQATINLLAFSMKFNFDYFFLISGSDAPAMSNDRINKTLSENYGKDFIHYQNETNEYVDPISRVKYNYPNFFYDRNYSLTNKFKRAFFNVTKSFFFRNKLLQDPDLSSVSFYKGTNWFTLHKDSVNFILEFLKVNDNYNAIFKNSLCGDEVFFHTILKQNEGLNLFENSKLKNNALRYVDWSTGPDYPRFLDESDYDNIIYSNCFFARKFKSSVHKDFLSGLCR